MSLTPTEAKLLFTKNDPDDVRLGDLSSLLPSGAPEELSIELSQLAKQGSNHTVVVGYADDAGILLNGGRPGARSAPPVIRKSLYKMTPPLLEPTSALRVWDAGDLHSVVGQEIAVRHELASKIGTATLENDMRYVSLGGGHDYGFPDSRSFIDWCKKRKTRPLVINFDAHLDVRPPTHGPSSGTPFYRMLEYGSDVDFLEIGIQNQCNSKTHLEWLKARGGKLIHLEEIEAAGGDLQSLLATRLQDWLIRPRPAFISVDIDCFSSAVAPGCSQSWATGLMPREFFPAYDFLLQRLDVRSLGIYEVSPPLDQDDRTSKLAAQIAHRFLYDI
jgi:formiminoglutamase